MPYINLPPIMSSIMDDLDKRVRRLETAYRFNAPSWDFNTGNPPNVNPGDIYFNTHTNHLVFWNGTAWKRVNDSNL